MIIVPVLTMILHVSAHSAIGTSLFVDVIASITVSYTYFKNGNIEIRSGIWMAVASIVGAQFGALFSSQIKEGPLSEMFGIILVASGVGLIVKSYKKKGKAKESKIRFAKRWQQIGVDIRRCWRFCKRTVKVFKRKRWRIQSIMQSGITDIKRKQRLTGRKYFWKWSP